MLCVCVMVVRSDVCLYTNIESFSSPSPSPSSSPSPSPPPPRYLIKGWLQTGRKDARLWRMYNAAVDGMVRWLLHHNPADKLLYLANLQWRGGREGVR